jgi:hypothetical protein
MTWFLELVADCRYSVGVLFSPEIDPISNRQGHSLPLISVCDIVAMLLAEKFIEAYFSHEPERTLSFDAFAHTMQDPTIHHRTLYDGMTTLGGALWESCAHPQWDRYAEHL